jgi:cytochrome c-type biogenesis protein CcmH/NrfG
MIILAAALLSAAGICEAQSPEALEQSGKLHFREAYFKAIPANDHARAAREFALAERDLKKALTKRPARISLYRHLGRTYFVQQKYAEAADAYQKAIDLSPSQKPIYLQLASAQEMGGNPEEAIRTLYQLRRLENDLQAIEIIDGFIQQLNRKVGTEPTSKKQRQVQP